MTDSTFVFDRGEAIEVGNHGDSDFLYHKGTPVENSGDSTLVYEAGTGLGAVLAVIDDFEDGDISEYLGRTDAFEAIQSSSPAPISGSYLLKGTSKNSANQNIFTDGATLNPRTARGDTIRCNVRWKPDNERIGVLYGAQGQNRKDNAYGVSIRPEDNEIWLAYGGNHNLRGTVIDEDLNFDLSPYVDQWMLVEVDWASDYTHTMRLYESDSSGQPVGSPVKTLSGTENSHEQGGIGFIVDSVGFDGSGITGWFDYYRTI